ncbi:hypothetical protein FKM82_028090 [Ascaphus truei]
MFFALLFICYYSCSLITLWGFSELKLAFSEGQGVYKLVVTSGMGFGGRISADLKVIFLVGGQVGLNLKVCYQAGSAVVA